MDIVCHLAVKKDIPTQPCSKQTHKQYGRTNHLFCLMERHHGLHAVCDDYIHLSIFCTLDPRAELAGIQDMIR